MAIHDKRSSIKELVQGIPNGAMLTFSGFTIWRRPMSAIYELVRQEKRDLHLVEVNGGTHTEVLVGAGCVKVWESCWVGHELFGKLGANVARHIKEGKIIIEDYAHYHMLLRLAAGAQGIPFSVSRTAMGTDIMNPKYDMLGRAGLRDGSHPKIPLKKYDYATDPFFEGDTVVLVPAAQPDVCIAHVQQIGEQGTVRVEGQRYSDTEAMKAADKLIVIAEEVVPESHLRKMPQHNLIPHYLVDAYVEQPNGAHPTGCFNRYEVDGDFIRTLYQASRKQEDFDRWLEEWVYSVPDFDTYLEKIGYRRLSKLRANSALHYSTNVKRGARS